MNAISCARRSGVARIWAAAWMLSLAACGGGGSDGTAADVAPPPPAGARFHGVVVDVGGQAVGAGREVRLVGTGWDGTPHAVLARANTASDGSFVLDATSVSPSPDLVLQSTDEHGAVLRAPAWQERVAIGPASEAFTRELLAATARHGRSLTEPLTRLARLQRAVSMFLALIDVHAADAEAAVDELRDWLADDPASREAFAALASGGRLPATLGDVGGLHGLGVAARDTTSTSGGPQRVYVRSRRDAGEFDIFTTERPHTAWDLPHVLQPDAVVRLEGDRAKFVVPPGAATAGWVEREIAHWTGQPTLALIGYDMPEWNAVYRSTTKTGGFSFDADGVEDDFAFVVELRVPGIERTNVAGQTVRALRIETRQTMTITLSGGGQIESVGVQTAWHVPFVGLVRAITHVSIGGKGIAPASWTVEQAVERAVMNDFSWPARVHLKARQLAWGEESPELFPIARARNGAIVYKDGFTDWSTTLRLVDPVLATPTARVDLPPARPSLVRVSPDGSKLYAAMAGGGSDGFDLSLADAQAKGAVVVRYDAGTLSEELRVSLPPVVSRFLPGRGYARAGVGQLLVSPSDASHFAVESHGIVLFRGAAAAPSTLFDPDHESYYGGDRANLTSSRTQLIGWDGGASELLVHYLPFWYFSTPPEGRYWAAIDADGLSAAAMRPLPQPPHGLEAWSPHNRDVITAERMYLRDHSKLIDKATGMLKAVGPSRWSGYFGARCTRDPSDIVCADGDAVQRIDAASLTPTHTLSLNNDLRGYVDGASSIRSIYLFDRTTPGRYIAAGSNSFARDRSEIYRIKTWPQ